MPLKNCCTRIIIRKWSQFLVQRDLENPSLKDCNNWILTLAEAHENSSSMTLTTGQIMQYGDKTTDQLKRGRYQTGNRYGSMNALNSNTTGAYDRNSCYFNDGHHALIHCLIFNFKTLYDSWTAVQQLNLCIKCLKSGQRSRAYLSKFKCVLDDAKQQQKQQETSGSLL